MSVENMIKSLKDGDNVNANRDFEATMANKITDALDAEKINLAANMVNRKAEEEQEQV
jgi:hypothetical protein